MHDSTQVNSEMWTHDLLCVVPAVWGFTPVGIENLLWNYITPGAYIQLALDRSGAWYNMTYNVCVKDS